jgi:hypothetical protein
LLIVGAKVDQIKAVVTTLRMNGTAADFQECTLPTCI